MPKLGSTRLRGPRIGSVIWSTTLATVISIGWGRGPANGIIQDNTTLAKIATVRAQMIASMISATGPYRRPSSMDFK